MIEIALNNAITAIHHIGSTAIPGLCAKPVIDILIEVADLEANFNLASTHFPQYIPSMHFVRSPQYTLVDSGIDHPDFNYVMDTHLNENHENATIASIITHFRERKRPFTWLVSPFDTPPTLAERLERHQCKHLAPLIALYRDLGSWHPLQQSESATIVRRVTMSELLTTESPDHYRHSGALQQYLTWIAEEYTADDPFEFYGFFQDNLLVACQIIVFYAQCVGIYPIFSTGATTNQQGNRRIMEENLLQYAKIAGYHLAIRLVKPCSVVSYLQQGFVECGEYQRYKFTMQGINQ